MKVVILAGGFGSRLGEETDLKPKPMLEIGGKPVLWHIMKIYSHYGFNDFIILLGYRGYLIKEYFANYFLHQSNVTIDLSTNQVDVHNSNSEPWKVTLLDTGLNTMTGGRILQAKPYLNDETFMLTYGDGVGDINLNELSSFHKAHGKTVTMTTVQPEGRFGSLSSDNNGCIKEFLEKPVGDGAWINGGFFVCNPGVFSYINEGDETIFERSPLANLAKAGELFGHRHEGFWRCMDTLREKVYLNELWDNDEAVWKSWT